jgi:glyoxylase-like metal-dependent hydrolase (beta-lactamase superfamily II)
MIQQQAFTFNPFQENTWILSNESKQAIIMDPGCSNAAEENILSKYISENELIPAAVWLTHCHIDHVLGLDFCIRKWGIPYYLHPDEKPALKAVEVYAPAYGFTNFRLPETEGLVLNAGEISLEEDVFRILFVPGHSPGHIAFYHAASAQIWAGDVLFRESIGRTDLPGGDHGQLEKSIREKLYTLAPETIVHSGHGPDTSIGHEKRHNPFVRG